MSKNILEKVGLISVAQASAADVTISAGQMSITGCEPFDIRRVNRTTILAATDGNARVATITAAAITANISYEMTITQVTQGYTYELNVLYVCPSPAPAAATFYAAIEAIIQAAINGGQILGTVSSSGSGIVFTPSALAPVANFAFSNLSATFASQITFTPAGSTFSTGVVTSGAATGATIGELYIITFAGMTGTDGALMNSSFVCKATSSTAFFVYGLLSSATITTTTGTGVVAFTERTSLASIASGVLGSNAGTLNSTEFAPANANFGVQIEYEVVGDVETGANVPQVVLIDGTQSSNANGNDLYRAILNGLNGTTPANALNSILAAA
jgi:hypothetical protein